MAWRIEFKASVEKDLRKLEAKDRERILQFLENKVSRDPRNIGAPLKGSDLWRYRQGKFRIICMINDEAVSVLVVRVSHRREAYRNI